MAALVAARTAALVEGDVGRMTEILAEDFTYTNASGDSCDRDGYLAAYVGSPDLVWPSPGVLRAGRPDVRRHRRRHPRRARPGHLAERAVLGRVRSLFVYVRRDGVWRCVAGQTTSRSSDTA